MTTTSNDDAPASKQSGRPSLYAENVSKQKSGRQESILSSLEPDYAKAWYYRHARLIALSVLLLAMAYWAWQTQGGNAQIAPQWMEGAFSRIAALQEQQQSPSPIPVPDVPLTQALPSALPSEPQAAVIITEPSQGRDADTTRLAISEMLVKSDTEKAASSPADPVAAATSASVSAPQKAIPESAPMSVAVAVKPAKQKNLQIASRSSSSKQAASSKTKKSAKAGANSDADVDLIAALLTRVSSGDTTVNGASGKSGNTVAKVKSGPANAKREGRAPPNRDIVQRDATESTAVLVKRCRALGFFEGELCRNRICSQRWGTDPACPGTAAVASPLVN